ncbi:MAG: alpha/beta hydrolase [Candidatus Cryptobacteroides sp.]
MVMKRIITVITLTLAMAAALSAQPNTKLRPDKTVLLYGNELIENNDPVVGKTVEGAGFEMTEQNGLSGQETHKANGNIGNISVNARFDLYFPKKPNGQMVIVCPGGGYSIVSSYNEGVYVADWMLSKGITVAIVKYRLPNGHWEVPLTDVQNTFRYCRSHAQEWGVTQIGVMGFSAGGHLAASATNLFVDDITRPDFSVLIYPVISFDLAITHQGTRFNLIGKDEFWNDRDKKVDEYEQAQKRHEELIGHYSLESQVTDKTPVTFIAHCTDDKTVPIENTIRYYRQLVDKGISAEVHIFPAGKHGWGFSADRFVGKGKDKLGYARSEFETSLERWLSSLR